MSAFGFDHNIILQQPAGPGSSEMLRTFADMARARMQQQQGQASLADLLRQQQERQTLADLVRQNAGQFSDPMAAAYARGGFGDQALEAQQRGTEAAKRGAELTKLRLDLLRGRASTVKTPEQYAELLGIISPELRAEAGFPDEYDPEFLTNFQAGASRLSPEEREARAARAEYERAKAEAARRGPREDGAKAENLRLRNAKLRKDLGEGGGKTLSPTALGELADYDTALKQVDELFGRAERENISGLGAKANKAITDALDLQDTKAAQFEGASAPVRQGVGTILEGGKLAAGDEVKYKNMLPRYGDSKAVLAEKKKALRDYLQTRRAEKVGALKSGGYSVPEKAPAPGGAKRRSAAEIRAELEALKAGQK